MKKIFRLSLISLALVGLTFSSCKKDEETTTETANSDKLIQKLTVDIPSSLSRNGFDSKTRNTQIPSITGSDIYKHMQTFIYAGEKSAEIVQAIASAIRVYKIDRPMTLPFKSNEDGRMKNLVVVTNSTFDNQTWDFQLTISDALSVGEADGGKALQVFWNVSSVVKGIAILKPYNIDRRDNNIKLPNAMYRIDYTEKTISYDAEMVVSINGLGNDSVVNPYWMKSMKMFAGKKGANVDVYGNSIHPDAKFITNDKGFCWAFAASSEDVKNIAVAEVGLPSSTDNITDRTMLTEKSIKKVFTAQIAKEYPYLEADSVSTYLKNTTPPAYFNNGGFMNAETSPGADWDALTLRSAKLIPFNPSDVNNLNIQFK